MFFSPKLDIQEFYEATLMDGSKSVTQKTMETLEVASKWEQQTYATPMRPDNSPVSSYVQSVTDLELHRGYSLSCPGIGLDAPPDVST